LGITKIAGKIPTEALPSVLIIVCTAILTKILMPTGASVSFAKRNGKKAGLGFDFGRRRSQNPGGCWVAVIAWCRIEFYNVKLYRYTFFFYT